MIHVAVCGAGAFGRNHIRILGELAAAGFPVSLAAIVEPDAERAAAFAPVPVYPSTRQLLAAVNRGDQALDAAIVCTPTSSHHSVAARLLTAGVHTLIEKPIAATLAEADDLLALARTYGCVLQVGHLERFNPAVQAVLPLLRGPMFFEAHRLSIFSPRSLDVDVVLDLMIHDLDIVLHLAQSPVASVQAVGLPILSTHTDIANVRVQFASGAVANFTASRVSTERVRKLRFFQPHQYVSIDYARQDLLVIEVQAAPVHPVPVHPVPVQAAPVHPVPVQAAPVHPVPVQTAPPASAGQQLPSLGMQKPTVTPAEPLRLEIESFLESIRTRSAPQVTGEQARAALALALQVQEAIRTHAQHAGLQAFLPQ